MIKLILVGLLLSVQICLGQISWQNALVDDLNQGVLALYSDSTWDKLYIGGEFRYYGILPMKGVAELNGSSLSSLGCGVGGCSSNSCSGVYKFERFQNEIYALWFSDTIDCGQHHFIASWNGTLWRDVNQKFYSGGSIVPLNSLLNLDSVLLVSGGFDSISSTKVHGIARFNGITWDSAYSCPLFTDDYLLINPIFGYHNELYAQNLLIDTLGNQQRFSKWDGSCWEKVGSAFSSDYSQIRKMIFYKDELYIAGSFDTIRDSQAPGNGIARWNGIRYDGLSGGVQMNNLNYSPTIYDMAVYDDKLFVVGDFEKAGSASANDIAVWNGTNWCTFNSSFDQGIRAIAFYHDTLYIGGGFKVVNGDSIPFLAKCSANSILHFCDSLINISDFDFERINLKLSPNPVAELLFINIENEYNLSNFQYEVTDVQGRTILTGIMEASYSKSAKGRVNVSTLESGFYFFSLKIGGRVFASKFFKL